MQLTLDLWKRDRDLKVLAAQARVRGLLASDVDLLVAVAAADQSRQGESYCAKSKRAWGKAIGRDANTAVSAMRRLERLGVLVWEVSEAGHAVLVDWSRVFELPALETIREAARERLAERKSGGGEEVVRGGEARATCSSKERSRSRVERVTVSSVSARGAGEAVVRAAQPAAGGRLPAKPWARNGGLSSGQLVAAVQGRDEGILTGLYWAGVEAAWWQDCESYRVRFLACCWQAATGATTSPMGLLTHMVRRNLRERADDTARDAWITQEAEDWVCETRRLWNRQRAEAAEQSAAELVYAGRYG